MRKQQEEELKAQKKIIENKILSLEKELKELKHAQKTDSLPKYELALVEQKQKWTRSKEFIADEAKKIRNKLFFQQAVSQLDESFGFKKPIKQFTLNDREIKNLISSGKLTEAEAKSLLAYQLSCLGYGFYAIQEGALTSQEVLALQDAYKA